jgi:hypothetical protein
MWQYSFRKEFPWSCVMYPLTQLPSQPSMWDIFPRLEIIGKTGEPEVVSIIQFAHVDKRMPSFFFFSFTCSLLTILCSRSRKSYKRRKKIRGISEYSSALHAYAEGSISVARWLRSLDPVQYRRTSLISNVNFHLVWRIILIVMT